MSTHVTDVWTEALRGKLACPVPLLVRHRREQTSKHMAWLLSRVNNTDLGF